MKSLRLAACIVMVCGLGVIGCGNNNNKPDGGQTTDGGAPDAGPPQLTEFAKDLILNHSGDALPTTTENKTFAPDKADASIFPASFFQ